MRLILLAACTAAAAAASPFPLSQLDLSHVQQAGANPRPALSAGNHPIVIGGRSFAEGFGTRGASRIEFDLDGQGGRLTAMVGMTDDSPDVGPVWFEVIADGKLVEATPAMRRGDAPRRIDLNLRSARHVMLAVQAPDQPRPYAAWADTAIDAVGTPPVAVDPPIEKPYVLTPAAGMAPHLNGAPAVGVRPGHPFLFKLAATGRRPLHFAARGLPAGLTLDRDSGRISGAVTERGTYPVRISARNSWGQTVRELQIVVGDQLALTPPMGWNSWNCFASSVTEADVKAAAEAMVRTGLIDHGWTYVNVDDFWETRPLANDPIVAELDRRARARGDDRGFRLRPMDDPSLVGAARDASGHIRPNRRFPDLAGLATYIHGLGLKAGLYSSPGPLTCGQCIASYGHEAEDASSYAAWGFDYLKYDWCSYRYYAADSGLAEAQKPYRLMGGLLAAQPRDIVFSLCQYGDNAVWKWGASVQGNSWRTTGDIVDTWGSMAGIGFSQNGHEAYAGPGHWNDPDMLVVGWVGWGRSLHSTRLRPTEQYTHLSLWSLLAAPLLIGCDLTRLDRFTFNLLSNDEVLAIDQDPLGRPARRVFRDRDVEVWARPLADGALAVGLFNRGEVQSRVAARWHDIGARGPCSARDVWRQKDLGTFRDEFVADVAPHGVLLLRITPG